MPGSLPERFSLLRKHLQSHQGLEAEMAIFVLDSIWNDLVILWGAEELKESGYEKIPEGEPCTEQSQPH